MFSALMIDADHAAAQTIQGTLKPYGFEFTATQDAPEAMSWAKSATPDIIFLRVELPNVSGFSVCNKLRRNDETKYIPLVMYASGVSDDVFAQHRNLKTHADEYLRLPFDDGTLVDAVKQLIDLPEGEVAEHEEGLEVEVDESRDARQTLELEEYDQEFGELEQSTGGHEVPQPPPRKREDTGLADETEAAFDALTMDDEPAAEPPANEASTTESGTYEEIPMEEVEVSSAESMAGRRVEAEASREPSAAARVPEPSSSSSLPEPSSASRVPESSSTSLTREPSSATRLPDGEGGEFRSQREVIQLKAQLNAKNREILALKEELESRDRSLLDVKHKNRELMAQIGDLEEKNLAKDESIVDANELAEAAVRDKTTILKREEGLKGRLEQTQRKLKEVEDELASARAAVQAAESRARNEAGELRTRIEAMETDLASAHDMVDGLQSELQQARGERDALAGDLQGARTRVSDLTEAVGRLEADVVARRAELERTRREDAEELARQLAEAQQRATADKEAAIHAMTEEHQAELEFEETQHRNETEKLRTDLEHRLTDARAEVERLRNHVTEGEQVLRTEREKASREITDARGRIEALQTELERAYAKLADANSELERTREELQSRNADLAARRDAERRAQQALAVALRVLDERSSQ